jgi:hypothetical protein
VIGFTRSFAAILSSVVPSLAAPLRINPSATCTLSYFVSSLSSAFALCCVAKASSPARTPTFCSRSSATSPLVSCSSTWDRGRPETKESARVTFAISGASCLPMPLACSSISVLNALALVISP